jgi:hypothetical protein
MEVIRHDHISEKEKVVAPPAGLENIAELLRYARFPKDRSSVLHYRRNEIGSVLLVIAT